MKMIEIKKQYKFNQRTFYHWLRDEGLIELSDHGYIIGPNALPSMENLVYDYYQYGKICEGRSQVIIKDSDVPILVEKYIQSGLPNLYTRKRQTDFLTEQLSDANNQIKLLEGQVSLLADLLKNTLNP